MTELSDAEHGAQVRERLTAATPGPRESNDRDQIESEKRFASNRIADAWETEDADLIAHAPADLARLLDRAERAEANAKWVSRVKDVYRERLTRAERERDAALAKIERLTAEANFWANR